MFWFNPIVMIAAAVLVGGVAAVVIYHRITHKDIRNKINGMAIKRALKYRILEAKKHSVNVGIFDDDDELLDEVEFTSDDGVSKSVANSGNKAYYL